MGPRISKIFTNDIVKWGTRDGREIADWNLGLDTSSKHPQSRAPRRFRSSRSARCYRLTYATPLRNYDVVNRFAF